ncbi:MAG: EF-P lysine aminoacylase EpmA [Gammaproteobacteria bacterium]
MQATLRRPGIDRAILRQRAEMLARIRHFFAAREVLEVETPVLSGAAVTDPNLTSLTSCFNGPGSRNGQTLYLHTSPEFAMKRLLAAGSGDIYQIAKVFRDGELGRHHSPEFTLLEWYRVGFDHQRLMDDVSALIRQITPASVPLTEQRYRYRELFRLHLGLDPLQTTVDELANCAQANDIVVPSGMPRADRDIWLDLLLTHCIEPQLNPAQLTFIYDYPASQAALARIRADEPPIAERFELYWGGVELANGFHELNDPAEQRRRFEADNHIRAQRGLPLMPLDEPLLAALSCLPDCAGVALGLDRLLMVMTGKTRLADVITLPFE